MWLERAVQVGVDGTAKHRHDPDFSAENFSVKRFGQDGTLQNTVAAARMVHYGDDDTSILVSPEIRYHRTPPIRIAADRGLLGNDGKQISLVENVLIERGGENGGPPLRIQTRELAVFPDDERAESNSAVTITQGRTRVTGSGLDIDNKAGVSVLRGRVSGTIYRKQEP